MSLQPRVEIVLWVATAGALVMAMEHIRRSRHMIPAVSPYVVAMPSVPRGFEAESLSAWALELMEANPFRLTRRPSTADEAVHETGLSNSGLLMPAGPSPTPLVPRLSVHGFVGGGGEWRAVLAGIPERTGSQLVRAGDTLSGLRVLRVERDLLVVQGPDTTWRLSMPQPVP